MRFQGTFDARSKLRLEGWKRLFWVICCRFLISKVENRYPDKYMEEAESLDDSRREVRLLGVLDESIRVLEGVRRLREHRYGATWKRRGKTAEAGRGDGGGTQDGSKEVGSADGEEEERGVGADEEEECVRNVLRALRELSISHSDRVTSWRQALRECARILTECPPGGSKLQPPSTTGIFWLLNIFSLPENLGLI